MPDNTTMTADDIKYANNHPNLNGLNTNLTNSNKWFAYFPIESIIGKKYNGLELHLTRFSLPQMEMAGMEVAYRGYKKQVPTKIMNPETKELTLNYLVDEKWQNYKALYLWMTATEGNINNVLPTENISPITPSQYLPLRIYLMDNYKNKIIQFLFENCWIKLFNDIALEQNNPGEVEGSFTCVYDRFTIEAI